MNGNCFKLTTRALSNAGEPSSAGAAEAGDVIESRFLLARRAPLRFYSDRSNRTKLMTMLIYIICLGVGLLFTLISAFFGHVFGGGHDGHVDGSGGHAEAGVDSSDMPGVSVFSPTIIASFVTAFGGFGIIFSQFQRDQSADDQRAAGRARRVCHRRRAVLCCCGRCSARPKVPANRKVASLVGHDGHHHHAHSGKWRRRNRLRAGGLALHRAGARGKRRQPVANGQTVKITRVVGSQFYVDADRLISSDSQPNQTQTL